MSKFDQTLADHFPDSYSDDDGYWAPSRECGNTATAVSACPLPQYDFVLLNGPDSAKFLQGQTTCDWNQITAEQASPGAYCNIKGRVMSSFLALAPDNQSAMLRMRRDICESTRDLLAKYIVFSKAEITAPPRHYHAIGVWGTNAADTVRDLFGEAPSHRFHSAAGEPGFVIQLDDAGTRFECWLSDDNAASLWPRIAGMAEVCSSAEWERGNIAAGLAEISSTTQDQFIPQQINYQLIGAVNFKKGCYTGQEIVARMQYRGKLKKRLYRLRTESKCSAARLDEICTTHGTAVGTIAAIVNGEAASDLLAMLNIDAIEQTLLVGSDKVPATLEDLPYPLPPID